MKSGDDLRFDNDDVVPKPFPDNKGKVVLDEMDLLYDLLVNPPAQRPKPTTRYLGPKAGEYFPKAVDRPLCPVGEP